MVQWLTAVTLLLLPTAANSEANNVMTDQNMFQAVELWCDDPTKATQQYGHISQWNTAAVTNFRGLFRKKKNFNDDVSQWDTSRVTSMAAMFEDCELFDQDLSAWNTTRVVSMSAMFANAKSFTGTVGGKSIGHWNVKQVARTDRMFLNAENFQGDLSGWRTLQLHHVAEMFHNAVNYLGGKDLANWHTSEFRDMTAMFQNAISFRGDLSRWDTSNALEMDDMFHDALSFDGDISGWDTSKVVTFARMFRNATSFTGLGNNGGIKQWNVKSARNFYAMFEDNPTFEADISSWDLHNARNLERIFYNAATFGTTTPLAETVSTPENVNHPVALLCWVLPNDQVKTSESFCGSQVRFDPCCATEAQRRASCCNDYCHEADASMTTCQHPDQDLGAKLGSHYGITSGNVYHEAVRTDDELQEQTQHSHAGLLKGGSHQEDDEGQDEKVYLGWEGILAISVLLVIALCCFWGCVKLM